MSLRVSRFLFFDRSGSPTLRYAEHAPPVEEHDHPVCNCTKNVAERPAGEPTHREQEFTVDYSPIGELRPEYDLLANILQFCWGPPPKRTESGHILGRYDHARFAWLGKSGLSNRHQRQVRMEITLPGYGLTGCFFASLYAGNEVDTSQLLNGWQRSKIVDRTKLRASDLWLYDSSFGKEAMRVFSDSAEASIWTSLLLDVEALSARVGTSRTDYRLSVAELREQLVGDTELMDLATSVIRRVAPIVTSIRSTELFRLSDEIASVLYGSHPKTVS